MYEYEVVLLTTKKVLGNPYGTTTTTFVINPHIETLYDKLCMTLRSYAVQGWRLKSDFHSDGEIMIIFERLHEEYLNYNNELSRYLKEE